jgi:hypothetical protein
MIVLGAVGLAAVLLAALVILIRPKPPDLAASAPAEANATADTMSSARPTAGAPAPQSATPPTQIDPMSGIPASHNSDAPPR